MTDTDLAIRAEGLSLVIGARPVLRDVDLDVRAGESVALTGANGAGKTTLLRCLAAVRRPTSGVVHWFGQPVGRNPSARRLVGMVAHESLLYPQLTLRENLVFAARMHGLAQPLLRADEMLECIELSAHTERTPAVISKGMRQRLAIARALVHDPPILLLDEPFAGLDVDGTRWLVDLLSDLQRQGRTLCFALHDVPLVRRLADRVVELRAGRLSEGSSFAAGGAYDALPRAA